MKCEYLQKWTGLYEKPAETIHRFLDNIQSTFVNIHISWNGVGTVGEDNRFCRFLSFHGFKVCSGPKSKSTQFYTSFSEVDIGINPLDIKKFAERVRYPDHSNFLNLIFFLGGGNIEQF